MIGWIILDAALFVVLIVVDITELSVGQFCTDELHADNALPLSAYGCGHVDSWRCNRAGPLDVLWIGGPPDEH